ncbi:MAG: hypothetical protein D6732_18060 [Methanobacteriota archaeon]|nr:MAG: hypothetical protein D6732_18060 [Euryarchaeota archaeon]
MAWNLNTIETILFMAGFVALVPTVPLLKLFRMSQIKEYLIFCAVFLTSSLFSFSSVLAQETNELFFWQLMFTARNLTYFLFFLHMVRMLWYHPPLYVLYPGVVGYALVQFSIIFWQFNEAGVPGLFLPDGTDIYSSNHRLLAIIFQLYVSLLFLYGYYKIQVENPSPRVKNTKLAMMTMAVILLVSRIYRLLQNFGLPENPGAEVLGNLMIVVGFLTVGLVFIISPSSIMLTPVQLSGILVLSPVGVPIASIRFRESSLSISPTLLGGIMTAIQTIIDTTANDHETKESFHQLLAAHRSILIYRDGSYLYSILTTKDATSLQRSSLKFFARKFRELYREDLEAFERMGAQIRDLSPILQLAFPYSTGLTPEYWE